MARTNKRGDVMVNTWISEEAKKSGMKAAYALGMTFEAWLSMVTIEAAKK